MRSSNENSLVSLLYVIFLVLCVFLFVGIFISFSIHFIHRSLFSLLYIGSLFPCNYNYVLRKEFCFVTLCVDGDVCF